MKAIGYQHATPIENINNSLIDIELPTPQASGHDLLIEVKAIAVNPVDCKVRRKVDPDKGDYKRCAPWKAEGRGA